MFQINKIIFLVLIILINGCSINNIHNNYNISDYYIEFDVPNDKYNTFFKEHLKRLFNAKNNSNKEYLLKTSLSFDTSKTLSVSGTNVLKSTKANVNYSLQKKHNNEIIRTGSLKTFPALSSSSNSYYSQQKSIENIKERLTKSSAKILHIHINSILSSLN